MRSTLFGRHLYNQIVMPLVLASLVVGVLATIVAVYFLSSLTEAWVEQLAESTTVNIDQRITHRGRNVTRVAKLTAEDGRLRDALYAGDISQASGLLVQINSSLKYDNIMILDEAGVILATTGMDYVRPGQAVLAEGERAYSDLSMGHPMFLDLQGTLTLTALQPIPVEDEIYTLALSWAVDDRFLGNVAGNTDEGVCFYDADLNHVACSLGGSLDEGGDGSVDEDEMALARILAGPDDSILEALTDAQETGAGSGNLQANGQSHRIWASEFVLEDDPLETKTYIVAAVSQQVSDQAGRTTTNLITMWSIFAVLALVGLGGWVARRVSDPLVELTEGARRIADGDFSTKIKISGANEIAELAESFNQMTDSLKERSESLTKKVLELATLYEMSRALGSTLEMGTLLDSVLDSALRIFNLDVGYVTIRDRDTGKLELSSWRGGKASEPDEDALRNSMSEWVIREGRPLIFNPASDDREPGQVDHLTGALAALCVPLLSTEGAIGAIIVGSHDSEFRFTSDDVRLLSTIANHVTIAIGNIELFTSLQEAYLATVRSLAAAVDAKDPYTRGHSDRVAMFSGLLAKQLGISHDQQTALEMAAYLHDIGKIGIKEEILLKPGKLTDGEMGQMRHHPLIGANILKPVGFPWPITPIVRHHHERWDGDGYPAGLKGEEIPMLARILTVADAYEAMVADRPYRKGRTREEGIEELRSCSGSQFDPGLVEAFVAALEDAGPEAELGGIESFGEVQSDEVRAIFVAICEGMLSSFRKLGGPRLASNVERELNTVFGREDIPIEVGAGHVTFAADDEDSLEGELEVMRKALRLMDTTMGHMSGQTLVDHFYADAMAGLSDRMRRLAFALDLHVS